MTTKQVVRAAGAALVCVAILGGCGGGGGDAASVSTGSPAGDDAVRAFVADGLDRLGPLLDEREACAGDQACIGDALLAIGAEAREQVIARTQTPGPAPGACMAGVEQAYITVLGDYSAARTAILGGDTEGANLATRRASDGLDTVQERVAAC